MRDKYRRVSSIFVQGTELVIEDDLVIWVQALNPFEQGDARNAAQAAKARLQLALAEHGSDELARYEGHVSTLDDDELVEVLVESRGGEVLVKITEEIEDDPEWNDRMAVLEQEEELLARGPEDAEVKLLHQYGQEYVQEVSERMEYERGRLERDFRGLTRAQLEKEFRTFWIERRGGDRAIEEFRLKEHYYAARVCDAVFEDNEWNHAKCDHTVRVWETEEEVRHLPEEIREMLDDKLGELNPPPKGQSGSANPSPSSESSPQPKQEEASTPSTPKATSPKPRGTSSRPSRTR